MRLFSRLTREGRETKVKISMITVRPSCVAVTQGGPLESQQAQGWSCPLIVVPTCTQPSWTSRMSMSRVLNSAPRLILM